MEAIKIVSDGTVEGTKLLNADGKEIPGATRIVIDPISRGGLVSATVEFGNVGLDISIIG